ncbi:MAG: hypothetical protein GF419_08395 [Ignavibacteriales bacterium]|nr:hypothetical protein [Ignavibacteriales bacterium]
MISWLRNANLYFIRKQLRRRDDKTRKFNDAFKSAKTFFVVLPQNADDFKSALGVVDRLLERGKKVTVLLDAELTSLMPMAPTVVVEKYDEEDVSRLKLPASDFRQRIRILTFDVVIDLNREENQFCALCAASPRAALRIGFAKPGADEYFEMQIDVKNRDAAGAYAELTRVLEMF